MKILKLIGLMSLLLVAAKTNGQVVTFSPSAINFLNTGYSATLTLDTNGSSSGVFSQLTASIGPFTVNSTLVNSAGSTPTQLAGIRDTIQDTQLWFCMDPGQYIYYNTSTLTYTLATGPNYNAFNKFNDPNFSGIGGLNSGEYTKLQGLFSNYYGLAVGNTKYAAALQLAIWEVVNENNGSTNPNSWNVTSGVFSVSGVKLNGNADVTGSGSLTYLAGQMLGNSTNNFTGNLDFLLDGKQTVNGNLKATQDLLGWGSPGFPHS